MRADVQRLAPVERIGTDNRLRHRREALVFFFVGELVAAVAARIRVVVYRNLVLELEFARFGQCIVGGAQARELGIAAVGR